MNYIYVVAQKMIDLEIRHFQKGAGIFVLRLCAGLQPTSASPKKEIFKDAVGSRLG